MRNGCVIFLVSIFFSSCYSYKIFPVEYRKFEYNGERKTAYVNPSLKKEYEILCRSGVFNLTMDSTQIADVKVELQPLGRSFSCGQPMVASMLTLGQLPVYLPDRYYFKFNEINKTDTVAKQFELHVAKRIWFWDIFTFDKSLKNKAAKTLWAAYYAKQPL